MNILEAVKVKGNNKRMGVFLMEKDGNKFFIVQTKTLIDRKKRHILTTNNDYSVETFAVLTDIFRMIMEEPNIKNKHILKELNNLNKFNLVTSF